MILNKRLLALVKYVDKNDVVVDIGSDHALLPIYLKKNKLCREVYACDISENAIKNGLKNAKKYKIDIDFIHSDGFKNIEILYNKAIISGMGTSTIIDIISNNKCPNNLIISSNNDFYKLRKHLKKNGFQIINEDIIYDNSHYYLVLNIKKGKNKLSKIELKYGISNNKEYYNYLLNRNISLRKKVPFLKRIELYKERIILNHLIGKM